MLDFLISLVIAVMLLGGFVFSLEVFLKAETRTQKMTSLLFLAITATGIIALVVVEVAGRGRDEIRPVGADLQTDPFPVTR